MARIQRKTQKVFGGNSSANGQFGSARAGTMLKSNDLDVIQGLDAWGQGWESATVTGDNLPTLEETQGVDYVHSSQISYLFQEGMPEYDAGTTYYINSLVKEPDTLKIYGSLIDSNIGNDLSDAGSWGLLLDLQSPGSMLVKATSGTLVRSLADRFGDMADPCDYGADPSGATDSTAAFQYCLNTFKFVNLRRGGIYQVGDLQMVAGGAIVGHGGQSYSTGISYPNTILRRKPGCISIIQSNSKDGCLFANFVLDGVDRSCHGIIAQTSDMYGCVVQNITFRYCDTGLGGRGSGITYGPRGGLVSNCTFTENNNGLVNPVDTQVVGCKFSGHAFSGVVLSSGSNDNAIDTCKFEFNANSGIFGIGAHNITVSNCIFDRNFYNAIRCGAGNSDWQVSDSIMRRNGKNGGFGRNCHIQFEGTSNNLVLSGLVFVTGGDDGTGATPSPNYVVSWTSGSSNNVIFSGCCFVSGYLTGVEDGTRPTGIIAYLGNLGRTDTTQGLSINRASGTQHYDSQSLTGVAANGGVAAITLADANAMTTFTRRSRKVRATARTEGTNGANVAEIMLLIGRQGGNAFLASVGIVYQAGTNGAFFGTVPDSLAFTAQTADFTVGQLLTGATSGATGSITAQSDVGTTGVLTLSGITGTFQNGEIITTPGGGSATADGRDYYAAGTLLQFSVNSDATSYTVAVVNRNSAVQHYNVRLEQ